MPISEFEHGIIGLRDRLVSMAVLYYKGDIFAAEDLVSETMIKMLTNQDKFEAGTNLNAWAYMILKNMFINDYRRRLRCPEGDFDLSVAVSTAHSEGADDSVRGNDILKLVDSLSDIFKIPFKMHVDGYKYEEIAEQMNLPIGTVKSRIFLARHALQKQINGESLTAKTKKRHSQTSPKLLIPIKQTTNQITENIMDKTERIETLKEAIRAIQEVSKGNWVNSKDHSISKICKEARLDTNWTAALVKSMRENESMTFAEGPATGIRYRLPFGYVKDIDALIAAAEVNHATQRENRTKAPILQIAYGQKEEPLKVQKERKPKAEPVTRITRRTHFDIDQRCYWLNPIKRAIQEVEIEGVYKEEIEDRQIVYKHTINIGNDVIEKNIWNAQLFETPEQLVECLLRGVIKFKK